MTDSDSDEEGEDDGGVQRSLRPGLAPEVTLTAKKARYTSWAAEPSRADKDLEQQGASITGAKQQLDALQSLEDRWVDAFSLARHRLNTALFQSREDNDVLNSAGQRVMTSFMKSRTRSKSPRRACTMRDFANALQTSQELLEAALEEYLASGAVVDVTLADVATNKPVREAVQSVTEIGGAVWTCSSCAVSNPYSEEGEDRCCAGCSRLFKAGEDEVCGARSEGPVTVREFMTELEQRVSQREAAQLDVEAFFPEEDFAAFTDVSIAEDPSRKDKRGQRESALLSEVDMEALARGMFEDPSVQRWHARLEEAGRQTLPASRRRRRNVAVVSMSSFPMPRTPREVPLFVSPLSFHADKYIGAMFGDRGGARVQYTSDAFAPSKVRALEHSALVKNEIRGLVRIAERDTSVIHASAGEWEQQRLEAQAALKKAEQALAAVQQEERAELSRYKGFTLLSAVPVVESMEVPKEATSPRGSKVLKRGRGQDDALAEEKARAKAEVKSPVMPLVPESSGPGRKKAQVSAATGKAQVAPAKRGPGRK